MVDLEIISVLVFFALIALWLVLNRKNVEFKYGIVIKRWQRGKELIDKLITHKRLLTLIGNVGIAVSLIAALIGLYFLISFSLRLEQAFAPVLPSVGGFSYPGPIISIPFWYWIIGIFVIIFFHESMHAVFVRLENLKLKSYGVMLFFILPIGAFVDPDEKQLKRLGGLRKLRILAAGSFINIILAFVFLFGSFAFFSNFYEESGLFVTRTELNMPAYNASLNGTIISVNGLPVETQKEFSAILNKTEPGRSIIITTTTGNYQLTTVGRENYPGSYIGVNTRQDFEVKQFAHGYSPVVEWLNGLIIWLFILNLGVGIANMLPIKPLDGGHFFETIFDKIFRGHGSTAIKITSVLVLFLFLFNIFVPTLIRTLT